MKLSCGGPRSETERHTVPSWPAAVILSVLLGTTPPLACRHRPTDEERADQVGYEHMLLVVTPYRRFGWQLSAPYSSFSATWH